MSFDGYFSLKLGELAKVKGGKRMPAGTALSSNPTTHPYLRIVDFKDGSVDCTNLQFVPDDVFPKISRYVISSDDLYISIVGTIGLVGIIPKQLNGANLTENAAKICEIDRSKLDQRFLCFFLRSSEGQAAIRSLTVGSTQPKLALFRIEQIKVPCPPLSEQKNISSLLGALDDRITLLRETNASLEAIAQAIFKSWFVNFDPVKVKQEGRIPEGMDEETAALFPDSFEESELGMIPKGWRAGTLGDLSILQNGYAFKSQDWSDIGHPVVKIGEVKPGFVNLSGCSFVLPSKVVGLDRFQLRRGDIVVGMTGYVGETGLVPFTELSAYLNQRVGRIDPKFERDHSYIYLSVRSPSFKTHAEAQSHGSAQANVSGPSLMSYPSIIAEDKVMEAFWDKASTVIDTLLCNHEKAQILSDLRDTLLPRLISGKLRIPEAEAIVSEAL